MLVLVAPSRSPIHRCAWHHTVSWQPWSVGCAVCSAFGAKGKSSAYQDIRLTTRDQLKLRGLKKHQESTRHVAAVQAMLAKGGLRGLGAPDDDGNAPPVAEMAKVVAHLRLHPLGKDGVPSVAGRNKARKIAWCVAEAWRERKRRLWLDSKGVVSSTIFQDARKGKLTVRFTAASLQPLRRCSGHLGTVDLAADFSLDAMGIQAACLATINRFCTPRWGAPGAPAAAMAPDPAALQQVQQSVEAFVSDAAADEIRAGMMLAGQTVHAEVSKMLPCLRVVLRDKPHASRRLLSFVEGGPVPPPSPFDLRHGR